MDTPSPSLAGAVMIRPTGKDSRWLTLEVCREFARANCPRSADECKYAHPPPHVEIQNGRVTCCYDSIKGKCQRTTPPCKYLHPPAHLQEQLLQTGKQNLAMKNIHAQAVAAASGLQFQMAAAAAPTATGAFYPLMYGDAMKPVVQAPYQTVVLPGQYPPYMAAPSTQYIVPASAAYQFYQPSAAAAASPTPVLQFVDVAQQHAAAAAAGTNIFSSVAASTNLDAWNSVNGYYPTAAAVGGGSAVVAADDAASKSLVVWSASGSDGSAPVVSSTSVPTVSQSQSLAAAAAVQLYKDAALAVTASSLAAGYRPTVAATAVYQQAAAQLDSTSTVSRKRRLDAVSGAAADDTVILGGGGATLVAGQTALPAAVMSAVKRPAYVDAKTGLPVYQPLSAAGGAASLHHLSLQPHLTPRYITLPVAGCPTVLPPF